MPEMKHDRTLYRCTGGNIAPMGVREGDLVTYDPADQSWSLTRKIPVRSWNR